MPPAHSALGRPSTLKAIPEFAFGVGKDVTDRGGKGPSAQSIDLLEGLRSSVPLEREDLLRLSPSVFADQNPASGIFYYLPGGFSLSYDRDNRYSLRVLYGAADAEGSAGSVLVSARLAAGIDTQQVELARSLVAAYRSRHPKTVFHELRPLPLEKPPAVSLAGSLTAQYSIPSEAIAVQALSDVLGDIEVSWKSDAVTEENLELALVEDAGLTGGVLLTPAGGGLTPYEVPLRMRLADAATLGPIAWRRGEAWRNLTFYSLRAEYVHVLALAEAQPVVYSWRLDDAVVPPGAWLDVDAKAIPAWLDGKALKAWVSYTPLGDCQPCDRRSMTYVTGGATDRGRTNLVFRTITPLADSGAYEVTLEVRSVGFDPSRTAEATRTVALNADNQDFPVGPFYTGNAPSGARLFEYRLTLVLPDGSRQTGSRWLPGDSTRVHIGSAQVQESVGTLPGSKESKQP